MCRLAAEEICLESQLLAIRFNSENALCESLGSQMAPLTERDFALGQQNGWAFAHASDRAIYPRLKSRETRTVKELLHCIDHDTVHVVWVTQLLSQVKCCIQLASRLVVVESRGRLDGTARMRLEE